MGINIILRDILSFFQSQNPFVLFLVGILFIFLFFSIIKNSINKNKERKATTRSKLPKSIPENTYKQYLSSDQWKNIREMAIKRADSKCELCGAPFHDVHHIKYPARLKYDNISNLLVVCEKCHRKLHGIRNNGSKDIRKVLYSEKKEIGNQNFLFEVKIAVNGIKYLKVTELSVDEKGRFSNNYIVTFEGNIDSFSKAFNKAVEIAKSRESFD
ncbi:MAG: HNH endonuclease [Candidatus Cloacimonetes bacterium]|nr:HNH endonuclease [Candidatus Cloacimonadota bacterium]